MVKSNHKLSMNMIWRLFWALMCLANVTTAGPIYNPYPAHMLPLSQGRTCYNINLKPKQTTTTFEKIWSDTFIYSSGSGYVIKSSLAPEGQGF